jgi:hypothetical protein
MAATYTYQVERLNERGEWSFIIGSQGNRSYALGWFHALTAFYPRPAYRLIKLQPVGFHIEPIVVEESDPASTPTPQCTNSGRK